MRPSNVDADVESRALRQAGFLGCMGPYGAPLYAFPYEELPAEAKQVLDLIASGGPFYYPNDDGKFYRNRGADLGGGPYFREFTVPTPGVSHRGKRRLVISDRALVYFTACHYDRIQNISPDDRAAEMSRMDEEWRHGFYLVTGLSPSFQTRIKAGMEAIHSSRLPTVVNKAP